MVSRETTRWRSIRNWRQTLSRAPPLATAGLGAAGAFVGARAAESWVIGLGRPTPIPWFWVSDFLLASSFGIVLWLWITLRVTQGALRDVERRRLVLDVQLGVAADIQAQLLPRLPVERDGVSWAARLHPAGQIGGDYYDVVELKDGSWLFLIADISGKGIPAALLLAYTRALFRQAAREDPDPVRICRSLSDAVHADTGGVPYVTGIVGRLAPDGRRLTCVNAGHPPGLILGAAGTRRLEIGGLPLGLLSGTTYEAESVDLRPGDIAVFVTDGVTESLASGATELGMELLQRLRDGKLTSADAACRAVEELAARATPPVSDWYDDRTVVAFRITADVGVAPRESLALAPARVSPTPNTRASSA